MPRFAACLLVASLTSAVGCMSNSLTGAIERQERRSAEVAKLAEGSASTAELTPVEYPADRSPVPILSINGREITVEDVLSPVRSDLEMRSRTLSPSEYRRYAVELIQMRVQTLARDALLFAEASKDLTEREEEHIADIVDDEIRKRVNTEFAGRQSRFEHALAEEGTTLDEQRAELRRQLIVTRWLHFTVNRRIADPTRDQLWKIFEARRDELTKPARREMRLIEIAVTAKCPDGVRPVAPEDVRKCREAARDDAEAALAEIRAGVDFSEVVSKYSTGWHKQDGGRFGWVTRGSVRERLAPAVEVLFALPDTSQVSDVIETPDAFFIVQCLAIDPGQTPDFASLQPELVDRYRKMRFNEIIENFIEELHAKADIRPKNLNRFLQAVAIAAPQPNPTTPP